MELRLKPVMLEHEGRYRCVAESSEGKDEKEGFLKVLCEFCYISFFRWSMWVKELQKIFQSFYWTVDFPSIAELSPFYIGPRIFN